jgi:formylglycine-generating enzyme required for sulfatase activity
MREHAPAPAQETGIAMPVAPAPPPFPDMVWIPGGTFRMGSNDHYPEEAPVHRVTVGGFWVDACPVTNAGFARFAEATGYVTVAERVPNAKDYPGAKPEMLVPGAVVFVRPAGLVDLGNSYNWWHWVPGACWRRPEGPRSTLEGRADHPVVHVAYEDVEAYARWAGKALPTEAEHEFAARGGLDGAEFAWGDALAPGGRMLANLWQGAFPWQNLLTDGYERTSPVGAFPPNGYGLLDMIGNVWEWTQDWWRDRHQQDAGKPCCIPLDPRGPSKQRSYDPAMPDIRIPRKVLKGGSHLCAENYCRRYRPAARMPQQIDAGTSNVGFRCVVRGTAPAAPARS